MQDSLVRPVEAQMVLCHLVPEDIGPLDGFLVHGIIVVLVHMGLDVLGEETACSFGDVAGEQ